MNVKSGIVYLVFFERSDLISKYKKSLRAGKMVTFSFISMPQGFIHRTSNFPGAQRSKKTRENVKIYCWPFLRKLTPKSEFLCKIEKGLKYPASLSINLANCSHSRWSTMINFKYVQAVSHSEFFG